MATTATRNRLVLSYFDYILTHVAVIRIFNCYLLMNTYTTYLAIRYYIYNTLLVSPAFDFELPSQDLGPRPTT